MLRPPQRLIAGSLLCLLLAMIPACRGATLPPGSTAPIRVGVVLTLDLDGTAYREAIELATREANAAGGPLPGRPIELIVAESMNDPDRARAEAMRLVEEGVVAIIGDGGSTNTLAIATDVTLPGRVPHLSCSATSPALSDLNAAADLSDRFFFRTAPSDVGQAKVLADVAVTDALCTRIAILHQSDDYGTPIATAMRAELVRLSRMVVATIPYDYGLPSYDAQVAMAAAANPDCVAILGYPQEAGLIVRAWSTLGSAPTVRWIGSDALNSPMFAAEAGGAMRIDGFLGTAPRTAPDTPEYGTFRERFRSGFARPAPYEPEAYTASCYDAAALLYLALADAGTTEGDALRDALRRVSSGTGTVLRPAELGRGFTLLREGTSINYEGASGSVDFDETGDVISDYTVWRFAAASSSFVEVRVVLAESIP